MYAKIENALKKFEEFFKKLMQLKNVLRLFIFFSLLWLVLICISTTIENGWKVLFDYPEEKYQVLETEATNIISSGNFDSIYNFEITHYSPESDYLQMKLYDDDISLTINVENYKKANESISIERDYTSATEHTFSTIFLMLMIVIILSALSLVLIIILPLLLLLLIFIITLLVALLASICLKIMK